MMAVFARREQPPEPCDDYRRYLPLVREDFCECCAYCLLHEILAAGPDNFELDHFKPKSDSRFADLATSFYNIYYSCHVCNHYKGSAWPSDELAALGYGFVDPCTDVFSAHFREEPSGSWVPVSTAGEYTVAKLRRNRKHLVEIRALLRELAALRGLDPPNWDHPARDQITKLVEMSSGDHP